jgi:hypothetical protein
MEQLMRSGPFAQLAGVLTLILSCRTGSAQPAPAGAAKAPPLSAPQQACLEERKQLFKQASQFLKDGKPAEALAVWQKHIAHLRAAFKSPHEQVEKSLRVLAELHQLREDFTAAARVWEEMAEVCAHVYGKKACEVREARQ